MNNNSIEIGVGKNPAMSTASLSELNRLAQTKTFFWLVFISMAIVSVVADLTKFTDLPPQFIGHADQANTAVLARNIAEGRGAVVENIWILTDGGIEGNSIPAPEPYWSIYVGGIVAFFFLLFSASLTSMLIPATLMKMCIAGIAAGVTLRISKSSLAAAAVAVALLYHPVMTNVVRGLSDVYLTFFMLSTAVVLVYAIRRDSPWMFLLAGLLTGAAIGTKPSGLLLVGLFLGYLAFSGHAIKALGRLAVVCIGALAGLMPLFVHNYQAFGSIVSPASLLMKKAGVIKLLTADHNAAFFDPEPYPGIETVDRLESTIVLAQQHLTDFFLALTRGELVPYFLYPFIIVGLFTTIFSIRSFFMYKDASFERLFAYFSAQMVIAGLVLACVVHWEARYWNFLIPFLVVLSVVAIAKLTERKPIFAISYAIMLAGTFWAFAQEINNFQPKPIPPVYAKAASLIPEDAVVFSNDPWQFSFHAQRKTVMIPYTDSDSAVLSLSKRYNVQYIVVITGQLRHPHFTPMLTGDFPDYLEPTYSNRFLTVAKFN